MIQKWSRWKVLRPFLDDPLKRWRVRELGRAARLAQGATLRHVKELAKAGCIVKKSDDVYPYYIGNFESDEFRHLKRIDWLLTLRASGLVEHLVAACAPDTIILFGSCAKGEDTKESDIDLFVQCSSRKLNLSSYEKALGRTIELHYSDSVAKLPKELRKNIINGVKLYGHIDA